MKIYNSFLSILAFFPLISFSQNQSDEKATLFPKRGLHYVDKDSSYSVAFRFRMQNQALVQSTHAKDLSPLSTEGRIRRLRLRVDGFLINPKLTYYIQLSFARNDFDVRENVPVNIARDAIIYYQANSWMRLGFGQSKLPGNRERVVSSGNLQFPERSLLNSRFTIDRDFGAFNYMNFGKKRPVYLKTAISTGEGRNAVGGTKHLAYTARVSWLPFGKFEDEGDFSEGDFEYHSSPKLSIAATTSYNVGTSRTGGQLGESLYQPTDIRTAFIDMMFKYRGWAMMGEFAIRNTPGMPQFKLASPIRYVYSGKGLNLQASKMLSKKNELAFRYTFIHPDQKIQAFEPRNDVFGTVFNHYFAGHRVKAQLNLNYVTQNGNYSLNNTNNHWSLIFQMEVGI